MFFLLFCLVRNLYRFLKFCCTSIFSRKSSAFSSEKHSLFDPAELLATTSNTSEVSNDDEDGKRVNDWYDESKKDDNDSTTTANHDRKKFLKRDYYIISATEYAQSLNPKTSQQVEKESTISSIHKQQNHRSKSSIVFGTVEEFSGMEIMMVIAVGLDGPLLDDKPDPVVRCRIYKALTRAHLGVYIVNEVIKELPSYRLIIMRWL